jgi:hypothetical protein
MNHLLPAKQRIKQVDSDLYQRPMPTEVNPHGIQETAVGAYSVYGSNSQGVSQ